MSKYVVIKVSEKFGQEDNVTMTQEMIDEAPQFENEEEAIKYCELINPNFLWVVAPLKDN